ncbi:MULTISPECIES: hypothetical protein [unclassified Streptosporangium]|uniref:hypothetical protein n=1 Tax=unclassified Streptosporangium TaxID=2632669 RepID=UPI002E2C7B79|nr:MULTISPECIES: hypothetical protein [unclassified Streptosporangium]
MQDYQDIRQDMRATVEARRDLGPEYETALIESFVSRLDATIAHRVRAEMHAAGAPKVKPRKNTNSSIPIALGSMGIGIPLTAIAAQTSGTAGLLLAWGGIVAINFAHALSRWRERD